MTDELEQYEIKQQITSDLILDLYDEIKDMKDPEEKRARLAVIEVLSEHMGGWLVVDENKSCEIT